MHVSKVKSKDLKVLKILSDKLQLHLSYFWVYDTHIFWGIMVGIPGKPQMVLSSIYKNMNKNELEWLLLHEAGHYKLLHSLRDLVNQIILITLGIFLIHFVENFSIQIVFSVVLGVIFGVVAIQLAKSFEYEAEQFAIANMDNPQGAIDSAKRAFATWGNRSLVYKLFNRWDPSMYDRRILLAQKELKRRKHGIIPK